MVYVKVIFVLFSALVYVPEGVTEEEITLLNSIKVSSLLNMYVSLSGSDTCGMSYVTSGVT